MRVYLTGAHSVGKSTLARYISKEYKLPFINEVARAVLSERELSLDSLRTDLDVADDYQETIVMRQIKEEQRYREFVSDRSFDGLAYSAQHTRILHKLINLEEVQNYFIKLREDDVVIFFVRPSKATLKQDGIRETLTWDGIVAIDAMLKFMLEMYNLNYFQINVDNMQERIKLVNSVLQKHKKFSYFD